jgi:transposase
MNMVKVKSGKKFVIKGVDMRLSFDSLKQIAQEEVKAKFEKGDICYFENSTKTKVKLLFQRGNVVIIIYCFKLDGEFNVESKDQSVIDGYLKYINHEKQEKGS